MHVYRHEIDGIRALAVVSVILFHAGFPLFNGGFVGVDVFFVISGYLITSIILVDHEKGNFSLMHFYERRARRILPALFLMIFCCLPFAYCLMLPNQLQEFAQGLISITLCASNMLFWMKEDYFNTATELNPLVHTWSLAIEEQFYILFSLLFVFFSNTQNRSIIRILVFTAVLSFALAQWSGNLQLTPPFIKEKWFWFSQHSWASYYLPTGRMWELLIGTLSAFYLHYLKPQCRLWNEMAAGTGLGLILSGIFLFDNNTPFPSIYAVVPTIGTALIIIYGNQRTFIGKLLSIRIVASVGLCSYSAYLWHQPFLVFSRMSSGSAPSLQIRVGLIALSFILAYFSWRYIETPFRNKSTFTRRQIFGCGFTAGLIINITAIYLLLNDDLKNNGSPANVFLLDLDRRAATAYHLRRFNDLRRFTSFDKNSSLRRLAILGDSFAKDFTNMATENNKLLNYQIRVYSVSTKCQIYIDNESRDKYIPLIDKAACHKNHDIRQALPLISEADIIILAVNWRRWSAERLPATIGAFNLRQHQMLFVVGSKAFAKISSMLSISKSFNNSLNMRSKVKSSAVAINILLEKTLSPAVFVNIHKMLCDINETCPTFTPEGRLISFDGGHLTKSGARFIGNIIFNNPPLNILQ